MILDPCLQMFRKSLIPRRWRGTLRGVDWFITQYFMYAMLPWRLCLMLQSPDPIEYGSRHTNAEQPYLTWLTIWYTHTYVSVSGVFYLWTRDTALCNYDFILFYCNYYYYSRLSITWNSYGGQKIYTQVLKISNYQTLNLLNIVIVRGILFVRDIESRLYY